VPELSEAAFGPDLERRSVLDRAHRGDIEGAFGRLRTFDVDGRSGRRRLAALLAVAGPGVVVMVADNDAGSLATFAQAGQDYGLRLAWLVLGLGAVLFVTQEMAARLGVVTGAGHARLIYERFGRRWGNFALWDLAVLNLFTLITELIGLELGLGYFGINRALALPAGAVVLLATTATGSFRRWEQAMYVLVAGSLIALPLAVILHFGGLSVATHPSPVIPKYLDKSGVLFALALIGTTLAPWQLFLQQSNVVDKRITTRWLRYERLDTLIGAVLYTALALAVLIGCGTLLQHAGLHGQFASAGSVATELRRYAGYSAGALFAVVLIDGSLLGAAAVNLATSYAIGDAVGHRHSLHRRWTDARFFYASYSALLGAAAVVVLLLGQSVGAFTLVIQALSAVLFPSAAVLLLLLCNDRAVLGPHVNSRWLNVVGGGVVGLILVLSALLTVQTALPHLRWWVAPSVVVALGLAGAGALIWPSRRSGRPSRGTVRAKDVGWSMPPLETLPPPERSRSRGVALAGLRIYLLVSGTTLVIEALRYVRGG